MRPGLWLLLDISGAGIPRSPHASCGAIWRQDSPKADLTAEITILEARP